MNPAHRTVADGIYRWSDDPTLALVVINGRVSHGLADTRTRFDSLVERMKATRAEFNALSVIDKQRAMNALGLVDFGEGQ